MPGPKGTDAVVLASAVGLAGLGLYLALRKPAGIYRGDSVTLSTVTFEYRGPATDLYVCWGLKAGYGDFNDGDNLVGKLWAWGGPIRALESSAWKRYVVACNTLETQPILYLEPSIIPPAKYDTYVWLTRAEPTTSESSILLIDTDAGAVDVKEAS